MIVPLESYWKMSENWPVPTDIKTQLTVNRVYNLWGPKNKFNKERKGVYQAYPFKKKQFQ